MSCALSIWHSPDFADHTLVMLVCVCVCVYVCACVCVCVRVKERERERDVYGNYWVSITSSRKNRNEFLGQPNRIETEFRPICFCSDLVRISKVVVCASTRRCMKSGCHSFCDVITASGDYCLQRCFSAEEYFVLPGNTWQCPVTSLAIPGGGRDAPGI